jgi:hypothetical protein
MTASAKRPRARFVRSRKKEDPSKPWYRANSERKTIALPRGLGPIIDAICNELDLEYSKAARRGFDLLIEQNRRKLSPELVEDYYRFRKALRAEGRSWD